WWRLLAMSILTYRVFPRVILLGYAAHAVRKRLVTVRLETTAINRLLRRMNQGAVAVELGVATHSQSSAKPSALLKSVDLRGDVVAILWRDFPGDDESITKNIASFLGARAIRIHRVAGANADLTGEAIKTELGKAPVVVLVEAWESP